MSRQTVTKSRADKKGATSAQPPAVQHEIVAGKFSDHDWNLMLEKDDTNDFVCDILDELVDNTIQVIYDNYIEEQLLPFTITQARDALLMIIEWQFLARDEGESSPEADVTWQQEEEPEPAVTDCWAQGSVPKQFKLMSRSSTVMSIKEEEEPEPASVEELESQEEEQMPDPFAEFNVADKILAEDIIPIDRRESVEEQPTDTPEKQSRKIKFRPYLGRMKSAGISRMTETLDQRESQLRMTEMAGEMEQCSLEDLPQELLQMPASCHSILKVQTGRPPGTRDVQYDQFGNVVAVVKLHPERLPSHRVKTKYHIVDPAVEAAQARLEAMRTGKFVMNKKIQPKAPSVAPPVKSKRIGSKSPGGLKATKLISKSTAGQSRVDPLPPPLIEQMEVSAGVTVREGARVKKGPKQRPRQTDSMPVTETLRPVTLHRPFPALHVQDLIETQTPVMRTLADSPPIPPILPNQHSRHEISA